MRSALFGVDRAQRAVTRFQYHAKGAGVGDLVTPELLDRMMRVREEVKKIEEELRDIYNRVEQEKA